MYEPDERAIFASNDGVAKSALGERIGADTLRFVRSFNVPPERVWNAITKPEGIAAWLGRPITIEPAVEGSFEVAFSDDDRMDGRVVEFEPNRRLAIEWHESSNGESAPYATQVGDTSLVTFDLAPSDGGGTILVFTHRYILGGDTMVGFGAGWHAHLQALGSWLSDSLSVDRTALYATLKPLYEAHLQSA